MTVTLSGADAANIINKSFPGAVEETGAQAVVVKSEKLLPIAEHLKNSPDTAFNYLSDLTAVDYLDYFELVYRLTSLANNRTLVIKVRLFDREKPEVSSVTGVWQGADLMEREIFDLMGIRFNGHPNLKRIFLWEGFNGHPLRKDYIGVKE